MGDRSDLKTTLGKPQATPPPPPTVCLSHSALSNGASCNERNVLLLQWTLVMRDHRALEVQLAVFNVIPFSSLFLKYPHMSVGYPIGQWYEFYYSKNRERSGIETSSRVLT